MIKNFKNNPNDIRVLISTAKLYEILENYDKALMYYDTILKRDHHHLGAINAKMKIFETIGNYEGALKCYQDILKLDPYNKTVKKKLDALNKSNVRKQMVGIL
ncbi:lipopolysaccharide assembly protein LapB [Methanococcus maripaludis]|uniref:Tetratricopeptide (TPR) repeat protein n=1 Tax=Methanococcus maripaludis TaxID=39152 RepID=A0A7J9PE55_METMI|nr:hypothetical protein [Methanococcus maripaludis]MBA2861016.1 tetratricopeptide (TPR) repeat protein [Methanococcus maripaludis]